MWSRISSSKAMSLANGSLSWASYTHTDTETHKTHTHTPPQNYTYVIRNAIFRRKAFTIMNSKQQKPQTVKNSNSNIRIWYWYWIWIWNLTYFVFHNIYLNLSPIFSISSCISLNYESLLADMVTAVLRSGSQPSGLNYLGKGNAHDQLVIQQQQQLQITITIIK